MSPQAATAKKQEPQKAAPAKSAPKKKQAPGAGPAAQQKQAPAGGAMQKAGPAVKLAGESKGPSKVGKEQDEAERHADAVAVRAGGGVASRGSGAETASPAELSAAADRAVRTKGPGTPIQPAIRSRLEPLVGGSLEGVKVHEDAGAHAAVEAMGARAFTAGRDIFLGEGESQSDLSLMAHEATHVLRPDGMVRRAKGDGKGSGSKKGGSKKRVTKEQREKLLQMTDKTKGVLQEDGDVHFESITVPKFKAAATNAHAPLRRAKGLVEREDTNQRQVWKKETDTKGIVTKLDEVKGTKTDLGYIFKAPSMMQFGGKALPKDRYLIGELEDIARELTLPSWDHGGKPHAYQVDHVVELQLAGWGSSKADSSWANKVENMQMLDGSVNSKSGNYIKNNIRAKAGEFATATKEILGWKAEDVLSNFELVFETAVGKAADEPKKNDLWTQEQVVKGEQVSSTWLKPSLMSDLGDGLKDRVLIFPSPSGGTPRQFGWNGKNETFVDVPQDEANWIRPLLLTKKQFFPGKTGIEASPDLLGKFMARVPEGHKKLQATAEKVGKVKRFKGAELAGYVDKEDIREHLKSTKFKGFSPIRFDDLDVDESGLVARGKVITSLPLFSRQLELDLTVANGALMVSHTFDLGAFKVPSPFQIRNSSLTLFAGVGADGDLNGGLTGQIDFGIDKVGEGSLAAGLTVEGGPTLDGEFKFESDFFEQASIDFGYANGEWSAGGQLVIGKGKVRGVKSGSLTAAYKAGNFSLDGTLEPDIPCIRSASLAAAFSEKEGLAVTGKVELEKMPLVKDGTLDATLRKGGEGWQLAASGTFNLTLPGNPVVHAAYENGALDIGGSFTYKKGLLSGTLSGGITNKKVDAAGKPVPDAKPEPKMRAYGGGTLTVGLSKWLTATVGAQFKENGEVELLGELALPKELELFPEKKLEKEIFHIGIDIPIVGVSVLGQRIGIFATIGGGLSAYAGVGPGKLVDTALSVKYNPDHEDETEVKGSARLAVPAGAGVRLYVEGSLGAGIPVVSARAGLQVGGTLAITGEASASVVVNWTPKQGLKLAAAAELKAQPSFIFDITGFVKVEADLLFDTVNLYDQKWKLASFAYGSGLTFGVKFPVKYEEGKAFDVSLSDVEFQVPDIDPMELLTGLVKRIA